MEQMKRMVARFTCDCTALLKQCNQYNPKSVIRLLRANEAIFLTSVSLLLGYNGTFSLSQKSKDMFT